MIAHTKDERRRRAPQRARLPAACPRCSAGLHQGLGDRHVTGPGKAGRVVGVLAVVLSLATAAGIVAFRDGTWGGYGVASAALAGFLVWLVLTEIAARCPHARRLRCKTCGFAVEIADAR